MGLSISFTLIESNLPKDYRRDFASVIKYALSQADKNLFEYYYLVVYKLEPFTFSVYLPKETKFNYGILKLKISIVRKFNSKSTDMIWFRNLKIKAHELRFVYAENRLFGDHIEYLEGQSQMLIEIFNYVELVIYTYHQNESFLEKIIEQFINPKIVLKFSI